MKIKFTDAVQIGTDGTQKGTKSFKVGDVVSFMPYLQIALDLGWAEAIDGQGKSDSPPVKVTDAGQKTYFQKHRGRGMYGIYYGDPEKKIGKEYALDGELLLFDHKEEAQKLADKLNKDGYERSYSYKEA